MKPNKLIAITGGIGSGKTAVSEILKQHGFCVLDCDEITAQLYKTPTAASMIAYAFGQEFAPNGNVDVKKLAAYVFEDGERVKKLNSVVHPLIFDELNRQIASSGQKIVFVQIPLLVETGMQSKFDAVWLVTAPKETRIERVMKRSGLTAQEVEKRINNQLSDEKKAAFAHTVINNGGSLEELRLAVEKCIEEL